MIGNSRRSQNEVFGNNNVHRQKQNVNLSRYKVTFVNLRKNESIDPNYIHFENWNTNYENFLVQRGGLKPNTLKMLASTIKQFDQFCSQNGTYTFPATPAAVITWFSYLSSKGYKKTTLNQHTAQLSYLHKKIFKVGPELDVTSSDDLKAFLRSYVADSVELTGYGQKEKQAIPLRRHHLAGISKIVNDEYIGNAAKRDLVFIAMSYGLSLRYDELRRMRLHQVEIIRRSRNPLVKITRTMSKTSDSPKPKSLEGDFAKLLVKYVDDHHGNTNPEHYLFAKLNSLGEFKTPEKPLSESAIIRIYQRWWKRLKPKDVKVTPTTHSTWTAHSSRVGSAIDGYEEGLSIHDLMEVGDWTSRATLERYLRNSEKKASANVKLQKAFL